MVLLSRFLGGQKSDRDLLLEGRPQTPDAASKVREFGGSPPRRSDLEECDTWTPGDEEPTRRTILERSRTTPIRASGWSQGTDLRLGSRLKGRDTLDSAWSSGLGAKKCGLPRVRGRGKRSHEWCSTPPPPSDLWDVAESEFLDKVSCLAVARVVSVDHKEGTWGVRLMCDWQFRSLNTQDRTETCLRVPGIRMPGHRVSVEESRIWRDFDSTTDVTVCWRGISIFNISGYEIFEMNDFPFDRQLVNLELLEFVWRPSKDADTYDFSMRLVHFKLTTTSMLPTWIPYPAMITVQELKTSNDHINRLSSASRFQVQLKIEREPRFYLLQFFSVTCLITAVATFPLALPPTEQYADKRLAAYALGLLTLIGFKHGMSDQLPKAPYMTFADRMLLYQIVTIKLAAVEDLIAYRAVNYDASLEWPINCFEIVLLFILIIGWVGLLLYVAKFKKGKSWDKVIAEQHIIQQAQLDDDDDDDFHDHQD